MEILAAESEAEDTVMRMTLNELSSDHKDFPATIFVGLSMMSNDDAYYTVNSGKVLNFELAWASDPYAHKDPECLILLKHYNEKEYGYKMADCYDKTYKFICQKTIAT